MAYHSHLAVLSIRQVAEGIYHHVQILVVKVAKALINKQAAYLKIIAGKRRLSQRESQTYDKSLTSGKGVDGTHLVKHKAVYHLELQCAWIRLQPVA